MRRFLILIFVLLGISSYIFCSPDTDNPFEGFWYDDYPVNDSSGGFLFLNNDKFIYFHQSNSNLEHRYMGSSGIWKMNDNFVEIKIEKHFFLQNPVVLQNAPAGKYLIGSDNSVKYLDIDKPYWEKICDKNDLVIAHFSSMYVMKGVKDDGLDFPCISFPEINNGIISKKRKYYKYQMLNNLDIEVTTTLETFNKAKQGNKGEWYPGNPIQVTKPIKD